ncbi:TolC family protein [Soonwooa sp.]|uniref:TolC family protein n=1 Tax=Soonwooa sp. TaxID=1938592 RepID=UPI002609D177|nr:TolC family protein [Soonwooa sp.]
MRNVKYLFLVVGSMLGAQQKMTLEECEAAFRANNLQLLAQQYNINMADADIMQAKIWDLPQASFGANAYDPQNKQFMHVGQSKNATIQQLIYLGGKKKNEVDFAKSNKELSQLQFNQLLADLKSQMKETYYALYFEQKKQKSVQTQLDYMADLLKAYKVQTKKGNISLKDEVRLQAVVIGLSNDKNDILNNILQQQQALKVFTGVDDPIVADYSETEADQLMKMQPSINLDEIKNSALENNADYLGAVKGIDNAKSMLKWQKSLNIPDLTVGAGWNQNGGIFQNEINFSVGIPIPLWKQNNGNVKKAEYQIQQNEKTVDMKKQGLITQIDAAYQTWQNQYDLYYKIEPQDAADLETVYQGILSNFRKGNISLIEFTDFTDSYKETVLRILEMKKQIMISAEEINHITQTKIFY